jgi:putative transposase
MYESHTLAGAMVQDVWDALPRHYVGINVDAFIAMPNHVHGIIILEDNPARTLALPDVIHRFKSLTTARYRHGVRDEGWPPFHRTLWQDDYYDHVIRQDDDLDGIRRYIVENPLRWHLDKENPERG